jgi:8-oxo-dGTP pyrophosphatase MutT (NUDIX family)
VHSVAMTAGSKNRRILPSALISSTVRPAASRAKAVRVSQLRRVRDCEQVAAVCYRLRRGVIEFLLVQTRGSGRWTFPKGSAEPGLTHAQAAAIEAFEEAGVHGRIEEAPFIRYGCRRQGDTRGVSPSAAKSLMVSAHLCEVLRLCKPKESNRNRTWFSVEDAKLRLREGRKKADGEEFARVVERALALISQALDDHARNRMKDEVDRSRPAVAPADPLQGVQFEPFAQAQRRLEQSSFGPAMPRMPRGLAAARKLLAPARDSHLRHPLRGDVLSFSPAHQFTQSSRLLTGAHKVKA